MHLIGKSKTRKISRKATSGSQEAAVNFEKNRTETMGAKKKMFIDKKRAVTYCLISGNSADIMTRESEGSRHVLWIRSDAGAAADIFASSGESHEQANEEQRRVGLISSQSEVRAIELSIAERANLGLPADGYDYSRHLRICESSGKKSVNPMDAEDIESALIPRFMSGQSAELQLKSFAHRSSAENEEIEETMKMLEDLNYVDSDTEIPEHELLQDNIFELADCRITGSSSSIAREILEVVEGTSKLNLNSPTMTEKLSVKGLRRDFAESTHNAVFESFMEGYCYDELGSAMNFAAINVTKPDRESTEKRLLEFQEQIIARQLDTRTQKGLEDSAVCCRKSEYVEAHGFHRIGSLSHDCESVLSLQSNVSHHPKVIRGSMLVREPARKVIEENKLKITSDVEQSNVAVEKSWRSDTKRRGETSQAKRERKAAVKCGRKQARLLKKNLKHNFEHMRHEFSISSKGDSILSNISVTNLQ